MSADPQLIYILVLLITGIVVGFACGLLGVGGGFIMVPVQIWTLNSMGIDPTIATRIALGTSLAVILPPHLLAGAMAMAVVVLFFGDRG
jgi:uncharacterized membrane protein YfcA